MSGTTPFTYITFGDIAPGLTAPVGQPIVLTTPTGALAGQAFALSGRYHGTSATTLQCVSGDGTVHYTFVIQPGRTFSIPVLPLAASASHTLTVSDVNTPAHSTVVSFAVAALGTLPVALSLTNAKAAAITAPWVTIGHAFARGDVPSGSRVKLMSGASAVPVQQDQEALWGDGSLRFAALSFRVTESFAAYGGSDTNAYTVAAEAIAPNRTGAFTAAQYMAANDHKLILTGFDCGSDTFAVSVNDVLTNFPAAPWEGGPIALAASAASGATSLSLASAAHVSIGQAVTGTGAATGTLVTAVSGNTVTIAPGLSAAVAGGAKLTFNSPLGGWELIRSGPACMEWRAWRYLKSIAGPNAGKTHTQVRAMLYVRSWGVSGPHEIYAKLECPNIYGVIPGGTVGPAGPANKRFVCNATVQNGSAILAYFGGTNDPRTFTIPSSAVNTSTFTVTVPALKFLHNDTGGGYGCVLSTTGTMPGSVRAGVPTWMSGEYNVSNAAYLLKDRRLFTAYTPAWTANTAYAQGSYVIANNGFYGAKVGGTSGTTAPTGDTPPVDGTVTWELLSNGQITSQGSGTITVAPITTVWPFTAALLATSTAEPIWDPGSSGVAVRPHLLPTFDPAYLTTKSKMVLPFDTSVTSYKRTSGQLVDRALTGIYEDYSPGQPQTWGWKISAYGDDPGDERVGMFSSSAAALIFQQADAVNDLLVRSLALGFSDYPATLKNERSGFAPVVNAGPNRSPTGPQYTGLGPVDLNIQTNFIYASYVISTMVYPYSSDWSGHEDTYGPLLDESHMPMLGPIPYLRTGHRIYLDGLVDLATSINVATPASSRNQVVGGTTYYNCLTGDNSGQMRGTAWRTKIFAQAEFMMPSADLMKPFFKDCMDDSAAYMAAYYPSAVPNQALTTLGMWNIEQGNGWLNLYQYNFFGLVLGLQAWRDLGENARPQWGAWLTNYGARTLITLYDADAGGGFYIGPDGGPGVYSGNVNYGTSATDRSTAFQTPAALWAWTANGGLANPQPAGFSDANKYTGTASYPFDTVQYHTCWGAALAMMSWAGVPKSKVMWQRWKTASTTAPRAGIIWAQNGTNQHYDLNTPQNYLPWCVAPAP